MKQTLLTGIAILGLLLLTQAGEAKPRTVRATDMTAEMWSKSATEEITVEFRQGDQLPVAIAAQGDLIETAHPESINVSVKRDFWIRLTGNVPQISFDGTNFRKVPEVLNGALSAGAGIDPNGGFANALNVVLSAYVK